MSSQCGSCNHHDGHGCVLPESNAGCYTPRSSGGDCPNYSGDDGVSSQCGTCEHHDVYRCACGLDAHDGSHYIARSVWGNCPNYTARHRVQDAAAPTPEFAAKEEARAAWEKEATVLRRALAGEIDLYKCGDCAKYDGSCTAKVYPGEFGKEYPSCSAMFEHKPEATNLKKERRRVKREIRKLHRGHVKKLKKFSDDRSHKVFVNGDLKVKYWSDMLHLTEVWFRGVLLYSKSDWCKWSYDSPRTTVEHAGEIARLAGELVGKLEHEVFQKASDETNREFEKWCGQ